MGALVASRNDLEEYYAVQLRPPPDETAATVSRATKLRFLLSMLGSRAPARVLKRIGRISLRASVGHEEDRVAAIAAQMPFQEWPDGPLKVTAVDVESGELRLFDKDSGVPLVRALAASCAVPGIWPAVEIDGHLYMDGGMRSPTNADLAEGHQRIVVVAPLSRQLGPLPGDFVQVEGLPPSARVALIAPDAESTHALGSNILDPARRAEAAQAGRAQAARVLEEVRSVWQCD